MRCAYKSTTVKPMGYPFNREKLENIRIEEGWTKTELGRLAGVSRQHMSMILRGMRLLSAEVIGNLENNADITAQEIDVDLNAFVPSGPKPTALAPTEERQHRPACPCPLC